VSQQRTRPKAGARPAPAPGGRRQGARLALFAVLVLAAGALAGGYAFRARQRADQAVRAAPPVAVGPAIATLAGRPRMLFRSTALGATYGRLAGVPLAAPAGPRSLAAMDCERVAYEAGNGLCLAADRGAVTRYTAFLFGPDFRQTHQLKVNGLPSRARLSPGGRWAVTTLFVSGHSYAAADFSTETTIWEVASGRRVANLEQFAVTDAAGRRFKRVDFNFWGVTFAADEQHFYATLASGGKTYLVAGDLAARAVRVLRENVECPSLSPDGTRLVYKQRSGGAGPVTWRLHALDLATMRDTALAETRSVDDQVEWLDAARVLYALGAADGSASTDVWVVPADGGGSPKVLVKGASSPAVIA
jgi:hypothetical protein